MLKEVKVWRKNKVPKLVTRIYVLISNYLWNGGDFLGRK